MRVICINNKDYPISLVLNKEYDVVRRDGFFYVILDESLEEYLYPVDFFEVSKD
jgi:hypothetical protein